MKARIEKVLQETAELHRALSAQAGVIERAARMICDALAGGGTVYVMGNGGSAADAQHLACELVGRFEKERRALPCVALTTDTSVMTSIANDYGAEETFSRQVEAFVGEGDVVIGISTSGRSANVNRALEGARSRGARTVALTGRPGSPIAELCDVAVCVPADQTPRIQEAHQTIIHIICHLVEQELFAE